MAPHGFDLGSRQMVMQRLLQLYGEAGADPEAKIIWRHGFDTWAAAQYGHAAVVTALLEKGLIQRQKCIWRHGFTLGSRAGVMQRLLQI